MHGARMVPGHAPLREGGGAAMNGISMHGKRQVAGAATGGVLRAAVATTSTSLQQQADQTFCESIMCKHASTAHRSTPPTALSIHSQGTILAPFLPSGGTPLSEGGGCLRMSHSAHATPRSHHHHPLPLKSLKNLFSILTWPYLFLNRSNHAKSRFPAKTPRTARARVFRWTREGSLGIRGDGKAADGCTPCAGGVQARRGNPAVTDCQTAQNPV